MVTWSPWPAGRPERDWDELVASLGGGPFQGSGWAEHKKDLGWSCLRLVAWDGAAHRAALQALGRRLPGGVLLWARGGPLGEPALWGDAMLRAARAAAGGAWCYLRVCSYGEWSAEDETTLLSSGWRRARALNPDGTFLLDLAPSEEELLSGLSPNWAHNLRRGLKRCAKPRLWENPDPAEVRALYRGMETHKGLPLQHGLDSLSSLLARLKELRLYRVDGEGGAPVALRACAVAGERAWDMLAATLPEGRKSYAAYALLWELILSCRRLGARVYDLGGADEASARGVHDFKKGTGARRARYLGEWDWASPGFLRPAVGWAAAMKAAS